MSSNFELILIILVFGVIALSIVIGYVVLAGRRQAWSQLADRAGLNFEAGNFFGSGITVSGVYQGHQLTLSTFTRHTGKSSTTYTRLVLFMNRQSSLDLSLSTEGVFSKMGKMLGMKDIQTGDEAIDQRYVIKGQPENQVVSILQNYDLRQKLVEAPSVSVQVKGQEITYEKRGVEQNENNLIALFDLLTSLANAIERVQP